MSAEHSEQIQSKEQIEAKTSDALDEISRTWDGRMFEVPYERSEGEWNYKFIDFEEIYRRHFIPVNGYIKNPDVNKLIDHNQKIFNALKDLGWNEEKFF